MFSLSLNSKTKKKKKMHCHMFMRDDEIVNIPIQILFVFES